MPGVGVIESRPAPGAASQTQTPTRVTRVAAKRAADGETPGRHTYKQLTMQQTVKQCMDAAAQAEEDEVTFLQKLPAGFAEAYFSAPGNSRPLPAAIAIGAKRGAPEGHEPVKAVKVDSTCAEAVDMTSWFRHMQLGFTVLVQGVGSKKRLLEHFSKLYLRSWAHVVHISGYDARLSLAEVMRDVLDKIHPSAARINTQSLDVLTAALKTAQQIPEKGPGKGNEVLPRPLCFVVHNMESLPAPHQAALSSLATTPGVHFIVSVDSIWATLMLSPHCLKNFNFCREEVHTFEKYIAEHHGRYPGGPPAWSDPTARRQRAAKASLGLVLKSLTRGHRELVQAIAEHQLKGGGGPRAGISSSKLLVITSDRMIAQNATKLRGLLEELQDHDVVAQKNSTEGGTLLYLTCDIKALTKLAEGEDPEESDAESDNEGD